MLDPLLPEYAAWLERVRATHEAVSYTCQHRLRNREQGAWVGDRVVAGLVARPGVFRYYGLPYSGRIATLAEDGIARVRSGELSPARTWAELHADLVELSGVEQRVFVLTCVEGQDGAELAASLGCPDDAAAGQRAELLAAMRRIATTGPASKPGPGGEPD